MGQYLNGYFYQIAAGAAFILVVALISIGVWQWQGGDGSEPTPGAGESVTSDSPLPGFPTPSDRPAESDASVGASLTDSANLEVHEGETGSGQDLSTGDGASVGDSVSLQSTGTEAGSAVGDSATVSDTVETQVQQAQAPPPPGGPSDVAEFADSADLVVRDSSGEIKNEETVK